MAKATTSKTVNKTDVAKPSTVVAEKSAATEKGTTVAEVKTDATTVEEPQEEKKVVAEKTEGKDTNGLPFKVNSDGTVNVWSVQRAGRAVTGSTGEVVTFDEKGFAKVKLEDALHFKNVPGFSFKE